MKNKFLAFGIAALSALIIFVVSACDNGDDHGKGPGTTIANLIGGKTKIGGTNIRFSVSAELTPVTARAAVGDALTPVSGKLEWGNMVVRIEGFYDPQSWNFTFSGAAGNYAFEFFGVAKVDGDGGPAQAAGKIKIKDSNGVWTEELVMFDFDSSILVNGTEASSPTGLPEKWAGKWRYADELWENNAQMTERPWNIRSDECVMTISPYGIAFWFDMNERMREIEDDIAQMIEFGGLMGAMPQEIAAYRQNSMNMMYNQANVFSIYEVKANTNGSCDVLASRSSMEQGPMGDWGIAYKYIKLRLQEGTAPYQDELWISFCQFEDDVGSFQLYVDEWHFPDLTPKEMMDTVRDGNNFATDRAKWENNLYEPYYGMFVIKR